MNVTFCGHSDVSNPEEVRAWLYEKVEQLILLDADMFLLGGYGAFDRMAASVVWDLKQKYPQIQSVLVKPYLDREMDESKYDWTVYPGLETVPKRYAISHRNRYMVDKANFVVAYVLHSWGGAAQTLEYANQKKKSIVLYKRSGQ
ncbi:MAG: hypothetical protein IJZ39_04935 [Oscillospiraceae bacterium]|nr:hypothetical protein [Oscillospiraceae bacterium]